MAIINAYWDGSLHATPGQADLFRVWARSWEARGWKTHILTRDYYDRTALLRHPLDVHKIKLGLVVLPHIINFSLRARGLRVFRARKYNTKGWDTAALVWFASEAEALGCGRPI